MSSCLKKTPFSNSANIEVLNKILSIGLCICAKLVHVDIIIELQVNYHYKCLKVCTYT